jgi:Helix-turn-helix domain
MLGDFVTMSRPELDRLAVMRRIAERRTTQRIAAEQLGLTLRQVERLYRAYKASGAAGLVSRRRGAPSNHQLEPELRALAVKLVRERYADFGPTLAHEKLREQHGLAVGLTTVRKWMIADGIWTTRRDRAKRMQQPRYRRACLGELVQIDGSDHEWFEERAPRCTLLVFIDDATGRLMELRFARSESTFDYFEATRSYLQRHGKPVAFYSDKAAIFRVNAKDPKAGDGFTQFGRAMHDLNIDSICANTPAAKGRVERANQTLQDRLVKELRLQGISTLAAANAYAPSFMVQFNRRFGREPQSAHDAHRPLLEHERLDHVFTWQEERRVTRNLTLHYKRVMYLLEPSEMSRRAANSHVLVRETEDGIVVIEHKGVPLPARAFAKDARARQGDVVPNKVLAPALHAIKQQQRARDAAARPGQRLTLREEDLMLKALGEPGLPCRRGPGRPSLLEAVTRKNEALAADAKEQPSASGSLVDSLLAGTLRSFAAMQSAATSSPPSIADTRSPGRPPGRRPGRPTIREAALARLSSEQT